MFLACLPAIIYSFVLAHRQKSMKISQIESELGTFTSILGRQYRYQISTNEVFLVQVANVLESFGLSKAGRDSERFFSSMLEAHPELANLGIIGKDGIVKVSAFPVGESGSFAKNIGFMKALKSSHVERGPFIVGPLTHYPILNLFYAIKNDNNEVVSVLFCALNLQWAQGIMNKIRALSDHIVYVLDSDGRLLFEIKQDVRIPNGSIFLKNFISNNAFFKHIVENKDYFFSVQKDEQLSLYFAIGVPALKIIGGANSIFVTTFIQLLVICLIVLISIFISTEFFLLNDIRRFLDVVKKIGNGDLEHRVALDMNGVELYHLGVEFNIMAEKLQKREKDLSLMKEQLQKLFQYLQNSKDEEARKIARDLHDEFGQLLLSLKLEINSFNITSSKRALESIDLALKSLRVICSRLRPQVLDDLGLISGIGCLIERIEDLSDIEIDFDCDDGFENIDSTLAINIYRIIQEALNNILKHSKASYVHIALYKNNGIMLQIKDNGIGFDQSFKTKGIGLIGMRERVSLFNGEFKLKTNGPQGVVINVFIPSNWRD